MTIQELAIPGTFLLEPRKLHDNRGCFYEAVRTSGLRTTIGHDFAVAQTNFSWSRQGVLRGIHGLICPQVQEKVVTCHSGAVLDVVIDLRPDSPMFGQHRTHILDAQAGHSIFVPDGVGHAFLTLRADTCIGYLCSTEYVPGTQLDIDPFDADIAVDWSMNGELAIGELIISDKDRAGLSLRSALREGLLSDSSEPLVRWPNLENTK